MYSKKELIKLIVDFIGPGGRLPFEHGFIPHMNVSEVTDHSVIVRGDQREISLESMEERSLTSLILTIFDYQNYCQLIA